MEDVSLRIERPESMERSNPFASLERKTTLPGLALRKKTPKT